MLGVLMRDGEVGGTTQPESTKMAESKTTNLMPDGGIFLIISIGRLF